MQLSRKHLVFGLSRFILILSLLSMSLSAVLPTPVQAEPNQPQDDTLWPNTSGGLITARANHTATQLQNGKVLVTGGNNGATVFKTTELFDPAFGTWKAGASLSVARTYHTATLLLNGKVLVVGGQSGGTALASAELYDPASNQWSSAAPMSAARYNHTATLLKDGRVLVAGGQQASGGALSSIQVYDPATNSWSTNVPDMSQARTLHTANLLPDGTVMLIGGQQGGMSALSSYDVYKYNSVAKTWSKSTYNLAAARWSHTSTVLNNGDVLVAGGRNSSLALDSAELLHLASGVWTTSSVSTAMTTARFGHTATLLPNGNVLLAGGQSDPGGGYLFSAEQYQIATSDFAATLSLTTPRTGHSATLLFNGQVLVVGGSNSAALATCDLYSPETPGWLPVDDEGTGLSAARYSPVSTPLIDGRVLVIGGQTSNVQLNVVDIYDPATDTWSVAHPMWDAHTGATATLLHNGQVLVAGGQDNGAQSGFLKTAELYNPLTDSWTNTGLMHAARAGHTATLLPNGQVMVVGGEDFSGPINSVEFYNPNTGLWTVGKHLNTERYAHTATLLQNGDVLVVGGQSKSSGILQSTEIYTPDTQSWWLTSGNLGAPRMDHTATLLENGNVLIVGGHDNTADIYGVQIYNPTSNTWAFTSNLPSNLGISHHTATLLSNGKVLVAGGYNETTLNHTQKTTELYDPATGRWTSGKDLAVVRCYHVASLLPDGKVVIAGGGNYTESGVATYDTYQVYDPGNGALANWRPTLNDPPGGKVTLSQPLILTGTHLRGYNFGEGSGGGQNSSASNYPLVQLRRLDNNQVVWLQVDPKIGFSETGFTSLPVTNIAPGLAAITVYVNGMPSDSKIIMIDAMYFYMPLTKR